MESYLKKGLINNKNDDSPLVSIIVPVYNVSKYLSQCLNSLIKQTYHNIEIVIIDDGSTDSSGEICNRYAKKDSRVTVVHTYNKGLSAARNLGIDISNGTYIMFADGDDWIELDTVELLMKIILHCKSNIVVGRIYAEYLNKKNRSNRNDEITIQLFENDSILPVYIRGDFSTVVWNKLYHRDCFSNIRFPEGHNYEDIITTWEILQAIIVKEGSVAVVDKNLFHRRIRRNSIIHTASLENLTDCWRYNYLRYSDIVEFQDKLLPTCIIAIGRMWQCYYCFSQRDREKAIPLIQEMNAFSRDHFVKTMKGDYPKRIKLMCLLSQTTLPIFFLLCKVGGKTLSSLRDLNYRPYK